MMATVWVRALELAMGKVLFRVKALEQEKGMALAKAVKWEKATRLMLQHSQCPTTRVQSTHHTRHEILQGWILKQSIGRCRWWPFDRYP